MERNEHINRVFQNYLDGIHSSEELDELLRYFELSEESKHLEHLVIQEIRETGTTSEDEHVNELAERIRSSIIRKTRPSTGRRLLYIVSAAALLMAATAIGFYYYRNNETIKGVTYSANDILPGTNKAILTLSDGNSIQLSEAKRGIIIGDSIRFDGGETIISAASTKYATLSTPRAGQYQVTLPDDTKVWLNAESSLKYPLVFSPESRLVELEGEAYFEVTEDKNHPFIVESGEQVLTVLGTSFNINSYENNVVTTLVNGKVNLANKGSAQAKALLPGQQAVTSNGNFAIRAVDINDYVAWKEGFIIINNATIGDVVEQVERWYDVQFDLRSRPDITAYVALNRGSNLSEVLDALEINYGIKFKIEGRRVIEIE